MAENQKPYTRRRFMRTIAGVSAVPLILNRCADSLALSQLSGRQPRNVILILSDDHRYDFMSFMGKPSFLETPNMDRLARDGAHLQNAFVSTSLCSPSRASVLTGLYTHKHGVLDNSTLVPEGTIFFPQHLQENGYHTAFMGKWHMGSSTDDPRPGFDRWVSFRGQGPYFNPTLNVDGEQVETEGYTADILTDYAVDWLNQERDNRFFLYLSHKSVHANFEPAPRHEGIYENEPIEYPANMADTEENYRGKPRWVKEQRSSWHGVDYMYHGSMEFDSFYRRYCETILGIDDSIGRILDTLEELGLLESTLVLYMGDNGFCLGEHGLIDKRQMYEESMRVPLLAHCPDLIEAGTTIPQMIQNIDLASTILEAAGLEPPSYLDGQSFYQLLEGNGIPWRDAVFYEYFWEYAFPQTPTVHGIRTDRYKYMHYYGIWDDDELYDIQEDPTEMNNLINSEEHQQLISELRTRVYEWLEGTDGMVIHLRRSGGFQAAERGPA